MALIGLVRDVEQRPEEACRAKRPLSGLWGAVGSMVAQVTGPRTKGGLARLVASKTTHGLYTKEKRAAARRFAEQGRQMRAELQELEAWFVDHGHLDKDWRAWFD